MINSLKAGLWVPHLGSLLVEASVDAVVQRGEDVESKSGSEKSRVHTPPGPRVELAPGGGGQDGRMVRALGWEIKGHMSILALPWSSPLGPSLL